jgi:hypothetical protein
MAHVDTHQQELGSVPGQLTCSLWGMKYDGNGFFVVLSLYQSAFQPLSTLTVRGSYSDLRLPSKCVTL